MYICTYLFTHTYIHTYIYNARLAQGRPGGEVRGAVEEGGPGKTDFNIIINNNNNNTILIITIIITIIIMMIIIGRPNLYTTTTQRGWCIEAPVSILAHLQSLKLHPGGGV